MLKKLMSLVLAFALVLCCAAPSFAASGSADFKLYVNGAEVVMPDGLPEIIECDDGTYIPLRRVAEMLGYTVEWNADARAAVVVGDGWKITVPADSDEVLLETDNGWSEELYAVMPVIENGVMYIEIYDDTLMYMNVDFDFTEDGVEISASETPALPGDSARVLINGVEMEFAEGTEPYVVGYSTYIPLRPVMEALGATVTWDAKKNAAVVERGGVSVPFNAENYIPDSYDETDEYIYCATQIKDGVMYIDATDYAFCWEYADDFGLNVGQDYVTGTIMIDDPKMILAENTASYSIIKKYLSYNRDLTRGTCAANGSFSFNLGISDVEIDCPDAVSLSGVIDMLANKNAGNMSLDMALDVDGLLNALKENGEMSADDAVAAYLVTEQLKEMNIDLNYNLSKGQMYVKSDLMSFIGAPEDTWVSFGVDAFPEEAQEYISELYRNALDEQKITFDNILEMMISDIYLSNEDHTGRDMLNIINSYISDDAFKKVGTNYVTSDEIELDGVQITYKFTVPVRYGKAEGGSLVLTVNMDEDLSLSVVSEQKNGRENVTANIEIGSDEEKITVFMKVNAEYKESAKQPQTLPSDAQVVSGYELIEQMLDSGTPQDTAEDAAA